MRPPLLPAEALRRVLRLARFDGLGVLTVAGTFALASAMAHDEKGTLIGLLVAGAGAVELHGVTLLQYGVVRGMRWLITSQVLLLVVVLGYVALRLHHIDTAPLKPVLTAQVRQAIAQANLTVNEFLRMFYISAYALVGVGTFLYQGGMTIYYLYRSTAVTAALKPLS